jgi:hypothetical protein
MSPKPGIEKLSKTLIHKAGETATLHSPTISEFKQISGGNLDLLAQVASTPVKAKLNTAERNAFGVAKDFHKLELPFRFEDSVQFHPLARPVTRNVGEFRIPVFSKNPVLSRSESVPLEKAVKFKLGKSPRNPRKELIGTTGGNDRPSLELSERQKMELKRLYSISRRKSA